MVTEVEDRDTVEVRTKTQEDYLHRVTSKEYKVKLKGRLKSKGGFSF